MTARWTPFSNGTEYLFWAEDNCFRCIKGWTDEYAPVTCPLEKAIFAPGGMPKWAERRIGTVRLTFRDLPGQSFKALRNPCLERVERGDDDDPFRFPAPDCPGQRLLWADLFFARGPEDAAPVRVDLATVAP